MVPAIYLISRYVIRQGIPDHREPTFLILNLVYVYAYTHKSSKRIQKQTLAT